MINWPTAIALREAEQQILPRLTADDPLFQLLPMENLDYDSVMWEQKDDYVGLQALRGLNNEFVPILQPGLNRYVMAPGVYGESIKIDEAKLTSIRRIGTYDPETLANLVSDAQEQLLQRRLDRIRNIGWTLLTNGTFTVSSMTGVTHIGSYTQQTYSGSDWSTPATATPLADFRNLAIQFGGQGSDWGSSAKAFMNRQTYAYLEANTNAADFGGKRTNGLSTITSLGEYNTILAQSGLPQIVVYDGGYQLTHAGSVTRHIPTDKVIVVGYRSGIGNRVGHYLYTRNAFNEGAAPGPYMEVVAPDGPVVPSVYDGHNGGPAPEYPRNIVVMSV